MPMFIALEVAGAHPIKRAPEISSLTRHVQLLRDKIKPPDTVVSSKFFETFPIISCTYQSRHVNPGKPSDNTSLSAQSNIPSNHSNITHEPRHDIESIFWLLAFVLARANPKKSAAHHPAEITLGYFNFCRYVVLEDDSSKLREKRGWYLGRTETKWREILHPDLAAASTLLHHMGRYLAIRTYDSKCDTWGDYHAHEMFKLLLFSAIQTFRSNPVPLCTHTPRYSPPIWNDYLETVDNSFSCADGNTARHNSKSEEFHLQSTLAKENPDQGFDKSNGNTYNDHLLHKARIQPTYFDPWYTNGKLEPCQICLFEETSRY
jgi:hypothetical protein